MQMRKITFEFSPVVSDENRYVLNGHKRLLTCHDSLLTDVKCGVVGDWSCLLVRYTHQLTRQVAY